MSDTLNASILSTLQGLQDSYADQPLLLNAKALTTEISDTQVQLKIECGYPIESHRSELQQQVETALQSLDLGSRELRLTIEQKIVSHAVQQGVQAVTGVKNLIAVASGKGGVGKSTVSSNLALALSKAGAKVAMLDADIYGPSQPKMLGINQKPETNSDDKLIPLQAHGIKMMSIGFMVEEDTPMIWRGPMVTQALTQMLRVTDWNHDGNDVDYMIIDLPPGTGDIQLTLSQKVPVSGAVIVTTPQDIALLDARKAYKMFEKVHVPILGVIENMSTHVCSNCGHEEAIFGSEGADKIADDYNTEVLGKIPLLLSIRENADNGTPIVSAEPENPAAQSYQKIAVKLAAKLATKKRNFGSSFPEIVVESS